MPTHLTFSVAANSVAGSVTASGDTRDYITFTIGTGHQLTTLRLGSHQALPGGGPGNTGFHAIDAGSTGLEPSFATAGNFLGGAHLNSAPSGTDLLPQPASAPQAGTGFTVLPGPGDYSYVIQQTSPLLTRYALEFDVSAAPAAAPASSRWTNACTALFVTAMGLLLIGRHGKVSSDIARSSFDQDGTRCRTTASAQRDSKSDDKLNNIGHLRMFDR